MHMIFDVQMHFSARYAMSEIFLRFTIFLFRCHGNRLFLENQREIMRNSKTVLFIAETPTYLVVLQNINDLQ